MVQSHDTVPISFAEKGIFIEEKDVTFGFLQSASLHKVENVLQSHSVALQIDIGTLSPLECDANGIEITFPQ